LKDVDQKMLDKGLEHNRSFTVRGERQDEAGEMQSKLDLITPSLDYGEFRRCCTLRTELS